MTILQRLYDSGILILLMLTALPAQAEMIRCETVTIIDGDTLHCNNIRIRLWGIDAPDFACKGRPYCFEAPHLAEVSKRALRAIVQAGDVFCKLKSTDRYGRAVAICYVGGNDLGCMLIRQGHAVEWLRYSKGAYRDCAMP